MNVKVSIPVTAGGNTGQREEYREYTKDYTVTLDGDQVTFEGDVMATHKTVKFDIKELEKALEFLGYRRSPQGLVPR